MALAAAISMDDRLKATQFILDSILGELEGNEAKLEGKTQLMEGKFNEDA